jgi:hypothetical protein
MSGKAIDKILRDIETYIIYGEAMATIHRDFTDYDPDDPDSHFRENRFNYWQILKVVHHDFTNQLIDSINTNIDVTATTFQDYCLEKYGFRMKIVDGNITDSYDIVDEKKYVFFLLKFE